ncbi:MAG: hypothetical protein ACK4WH_07255 [Phycisphaerales bacterium]
MSKQDKTAADAASVVGVAEAPACPVKNRWLRRIGAAGFMFFLIKGLLWLTVPAAVAVWRGCAAG